MRPIRRKKQSIKPTNMTPYPPKVRRPLYNYPDKYAALIRQGFDEAAASRMAHNIPVIYG